MMREDVSHQVRYPIRIYDTPFSQSELAAYSGHYGVNIDIQHYQASTQSSAFHALFFIDWPAIRTKNNLAF